jgi:hypothetical protein
MRAGSSASGWHHESHSQADHQSTVAHIDVTSTGVPDSRIGDKSKSETTVTGNPPNLRTQYRL